MNVGRKLGIRIWLKKTLCNFSTLCTRNGVKLEYLFEIYSIQKFAIRLIRKVKNNSKNSIKINSKFVRLDLTPPLLGILDIFHRKNIKPH